MTNIIKVTFKPRKKVGSITAAPVNCKDHHYYVAEKELGFAIETARALFKEENELHRYYDKCIAKNIRVI